MFLEDKNSNPSTISTARENRGTLIALLRDPARWPEGFKWRYQNCTTCALGLLQRTLMPLSKENYELAYQQLWSGEATVFSEFVGLSGDDALMIFGTAWISVGYIEDIKAEHIAALLEAAPYV